MFAETSESVGVYDMAEEVCTEAEQSFIFVDLFFFSVVCLLLILKYIFGVLLRQCTEKGQRYALFHHHMRLEISKSQDPCESVY